MTVDELIAVLNRLALQGANNGALEVRFYLDEPEQEFLVEGVEINDDDGRVVLLTGNPL